MKQQNIAINNPIHHNNTFFSQSPRRIQQIPLSTQLKLTQLQNQQLTNTSTHKNGTPHNILSPTENTRSDWNRAGMMTQQDKNFSSMWSKGHRLGESRVVSQRASTESRGFSQPVSPLSKQAHQSFIKQLPLEIPALTSKNKRTMLEFHKKMLNQIVTKSNKRLSFSQIDEDKEVLKFDLQNQNEESSKRKISMRGLIHHEDDNNHEKWRDFKNKSLLEVLNNNKRYEQSDSGLNEELNNSLQNQVKSNNVKQMFKTNAFSHQNSPRQQLINEKQLFKQNPGMSQLDRDFQVMRKSIEKLKKTPLDGVQNKQLKDFESHMNKNYENAYQSELGDEYSRQERQLSLMISQVRKKTEMMRKRKMHSVYKSKGYPGFDTGGSSTKNNENLEENVNNQINSQRVKDYLESNLHPVSGNGRQSLLKQSVNSQMKPQDIKINLKDEYINHLHIVSKLKCFSSLKLYLDHSFYQVFMPENKQVTQNQADIEDNVESMYENKYAKSVHVPTLHSYLEPQQEESIPSDNINYSTTKRLSAIYYEAKMYLEKMIKKKEIQNIKQEEMDVNLEQLRIFFLDVFKMFQQLMKGLKYQEEKPDVMPAFILDYLFKIIMMKVDDIIQNNQRVINQAIEMQKFQVKQLKKEAENEMESMNNQIQLLRKQHAEKYKIMKEKLETAYSDTQRYKDMFHEVENELSQLTDFDKRNARMEDLKDSYNEINQLIMESEDQKLKQIAALEQYTQMLDFGMGFGKKNLSKSPQQKIPPRETKFSKQDLNLKLLVDHEFQKGPLTQIQQSSTTENRTLMEDIIGLVDQTPAKTGPR
ncbi:UNKNOWN [Stylonychia lemnae]|uniref:Uncharacterized protein n=1 Tax=Stylonychia lemnae TaxID=5949 RepID=A0A078AAH5_STYLE|nr:UNKNOWN [Stylonychia lemnae]|eukprot:CDW79204.1 UNKNOWN [Stylonychia lemnae]